MPKGTLVATDETDDREGPADLRRNRIRELALNALRQGRVEETEAFLQAENLSVAQLTQDLLVHQAELEMQAEELWEANLQLHKARERFSRFFRFLPHPALIIDPVTATIMEANERARTQFAVEGNARGVGALLRRLGQGRNAQDLLASAVAEAYARGEAQLTDVRLALQSGAAWRGGISMVRIDEDSRNGAVILAVISDETERYAQIDRLSSESRLEGAFASLLDLANRPALSLEAVLQKAPDIFVEAIGVEADACVRIRFDGREYLSNGWSEQADLNVLPITSKAAGVGTIEFGIAEGSVAGDPMDGRSRPSLRTYWLLADLLGRIIEDRQLRRDLEKAERLAAAGQIAAGIAHDFNNLLTVILGEAETISGAEGLPPHLREGAGFIETASLKAAQLTHYLLAYSRQQALEPERVRPVLLVERCLPGWQNMLGPKISLRLVAPSDGWEIEADAGQLESAVLNLILNARDAIEEEGDIVITLRNLDFAQQMALGRAPERPAVVVLEVRDTGCGMTPEVLAKAQEPFFTTKERGKASGLGLSMITGFVQQTGGILDIVSSPGQGTRVLMFFPAAVDSGAA